MADKPEFDTPEKFKKAISNDVKTTRLGLELAEISGKPDKAKIFQDDLKALFQLAVGNANNNISDLAIPELSANPLKQSDSKLTPDEVIAGMARSEAYEKNADLIAGAKTPKLAGEALDKIKTDTEKLIKDPELIKKANTEFQRLEKNFPDNNPNDGVIDMIEVASKELDFLRKTFPKEMKEVEDGRVLFLTQFLVMMGKAHYYQGDAYGVCSVMPEGTGRDLSVAA